MSAVGELHPVRARLAIDDRQRVLAGVNLDTQFLDLAAQYPRTAFVHLYRHQARRKFDDMRREPHVAQRLGAFESEQTATDHHPGLRAGAACLHRFEILNGAIDETVLTIASRHRRHERRGARGKHQLVIGKRLTCREGHGVRRPVDRHGLRIEFEHHIVAIEEAWFDKRQILRGLAGKEFGQVNAVVGRARLFAQHSHVQCVRGVVREAFEKLVANHPVADHDDVHDRGFIRFECCSRHHFRPANKKASRGPGRKRPDSGDAVVQKPV
ncbi:hypothetical protein P3T23_008671 [Paraburkholderia sp. GAS448]